MSLSGTQLTRIGVLGAPGLAYSGFTAKEETIPGIWSDASTNSALWYTVNPTSTVWDAGATSWDLDGNVYNTVWDDKDTVYSDATTTSVTWSDA